MGEVIRKVLKLLTIHAANDFLLTFREHECEYQQDINSEFCISTSWGSCRIIESILRTNLYILNMNI